MVYKMNPSKSKSTVRYSGRLTEKDIKSWLKNGTTTTLFDNSQLYLKRRVKKPSWLVRFKLEGKPPTVMSIGKYSDNGMGGLTLNQGREYYYTRVFPLLQEGINPISERNRTRIENTRKSTTIFKDYCEKWLREKIQDRIWKNVKYQEKVEGRLKNYIYPSLGKMSCDSITEEDIIDKVLKPLINKGVIETSKRVFWYLKDIFDDLESQRLIKNNPTKYVLKWLNKRVSKLSTNTPKNHYPSFHSWKEVGEVMCKMEDYKPSITTYYSHLLLWFTVVRINNIVTSKWKDFNFENRNPYWLIPSEEMKSSHVDLKVPLSKPIVSFLKEYKKWYDEQHFNSEYLFPSRVSISKHITLENLEKCYRNGIGLKGCHTPHGVRSSFSTLCNHHYSSLKEDMRKPIELCLHHQVGSTIERTYNEPRVDEMIVLRREIYKWWGDMLMKVWNDTRQRQEKESQSSKTRKSSKKS